MKWLTVLYILHVYKNKLPAFDMILKIITADRVVKTFFMVTNFTVCVISKNFSAEPDPTDEMKCVD